MNPLSAAPFCRAFLSSTSCLNNKHKTHAALFFSLLQIVTFSLSLGFFFGQKLNPLRFPSSLSLSFFVLD